MDKLQFGNLLIVILVRIDCKNPLSRRIKAKIKNCAKSVWNKFKVYQCLCYSQ